MIEDFDARRDANRIDDELVDEMQRRARAVSADLPGRARVDVVSFDRTTGNPAVIVSSDGSDGPVGSHFQDVDADAENLDPAASTRAGDDPDASRRSVVSADDDLAGRALRHLQQIGPALGLAPEQPPEFAIDPHVQRTSSGGAAVHVRQQYRGLMIYEATETVRFDPKGRLTEVAGRTHTVTGEHSTVPRVDANTAVRTAASDVSDALSGAEPDPFGQRADIGLDMDDFSPAVIAADPSGPERRTTFAAAPFSSCSAQLVWFPMDDSLLLAWQVLLHIEHGPQFRVIVDAMVGAVLLRRQLSRAIVARADVFLDGGGLAAERTVLPVPLDRYGLDALSLPPNEPVPWLVDASTGGSNAFASADGLAPVTGAPDTNGGVSFSAASGSVDELVVNLFAYAGIMHDVFYALGFREADGNFQLDNRGRGGAGSDRLRAVVHPGPVWGTANMATPFDGFAPEMNMGLVSSTGRHTALDPDVVFHEFTHGVSNRLVGGPLNSAALDAPQSGGMGEGWGDYFACVLNRRDTVGSWVTGNPRGIRAFRYDESFPDDFGDIGTGRYVDVHEIGEIWCATLLELNRRIGTETAIQLVVDALKVSVANPGFLAMRDAILVAARDHGAASLDAAEAAALEHGVWSAFARFGMGPGASSIEATLAPVIADFTTPTAPIAGTHVSGSVEPGLAIPDADPRGVASTITFDTPGTIAALEVEVRITHTYRGDLVVRLRAPDGRVAMLHERSGGGADDLIGTWTTADDSVAALVDSPITGDWTLEVVDLALRDVGTLDAWSIDATVEAARTAVGQEVVTGLLIPDDDPNGVTSELTLSGTTPITAAEVSVDITHTYVGDLVVALRTPSGSRVVLHDRAGGGSDNLIRTWTTHDAPLGELIGRSVDGTWRLEVSDHAGRDIGKLNRWSLHTTL